MGLYTPIWYSCNNCRCSFSFNNSHNTKNHKNSLLLKLEHGLSPYVAFGIMPIFAFANAGVSLEGLTFATLLNPVPLGIVLGLFFGKQIGVFVLSYLSVKLKLQTNLIIQLGQHSTQCQF